MSQSSSIKSVEDYFTVSTDSRRGDYLDEVIEIWKKYRATLGLFPKGAFQDHAAKNWILYLLNEGKVAEYLLYRMAKGRAVIVHLCVDEAHRRKGGAKALFEHFRSHIEDGHCRGIEVKCRGDYPIAPIWPKLGFQFVKAGLGRGKNPSELVKWFFHFDVEDFFYGLLPKSEDDDQVWAVLDANIIFKLSEPEQVENQEACALMAETVSSYANFMVTPEIFAEIERKKDQTQKEASRKAANHFQRVEVRRSEFDHCISILESLWVDVSAPRDQSDLNHIAYTAAAGIRIFVTQDQGILERSASIHERVGVRVLCPADFISELDALENESRYIPVSIARSIFSKRCPKSEDVSTIAQAFTNVRDGEKRKQFEAKLRSAIASVETHDVRLIVGARGEYIMISILEKGAKELKVSVLRHNGSQLAEALAQNWIWEILSYKDEGEVVQLSICDAFIPSGILELFSQRGFIRTTEGIERAAIKEIIETAELEKRIGALAENKPESYQLVLEHIKEQSRVPSHHLEEAFWPLKLSDSNVPTFLIPIQPTWAKDLFDEGLALENLFGADPNRFFNWENVYYRSARAVSFQPGSRILWYVSAEKGNKISAIRACSRYLSHEIGSAKNLYSKYRRLGIYEWRNLMQLTKGDVHGQLMAIRFYQTECFKEPVPLEEFSMYGIKCAPMSVRGLSAAQFNSIYRSGMKINDGQ